jgi:hypothetical protein
MVHRAILMADADAGTPMVTADRATKATDGAKVLLAGSERIIAPRAIVGDWPITAPSHEASAAEVSWVDEKAVDVPALPRVRSSDASITNLIDRATATSPTFKTLRARIDASDGIVYVESGQCSHGVWACIEFWMHTSGPNRFLRIVLDRRNTASDKELMGSIGHELWHALEVLRERSITDGLRMFTFYEREGAPHGGRFETNAAILAGNAVRRELGLHW